MEIVLIFLVATLMGGFNFAFFLLGYHVRGKKQTDEGFALTDNNRKFVEEMAKWRAFGGNNGTNS